MRYIIIGMVAAILCGCSVDSDKAEISTKYGNIEILLYDDTPVHRKNFIKLVSDGFYDSLLFHRVMPGFIVQGGDPTSRSAKRGALLGENDCGYTLTGEFRYPKHIHRRGAIGAARKGDRHNPDKRSSGSQFYIVQGKSFTDAELDAVEAGKNNTIKQNIYYKILPQYQDSLKFYQDNNMRLELSDLQLQIMTRVNEIAEQEGLFQFSDSVREIYRTIGGAPYLDGDYTVFGEVTDGFDVIDSIASQSIDLHSRPYDDIRMNIKINN